VKQLLIDGLVDACAFCIDTDARRAVAKPVFAVRCEGLTWHVCGPHLGALIKAQEKPTEPAPARPEPKADVRQNGPPVVLPAAK